MALGDHLFTGIASGRFEHGILVPCINHEDAGVIEAKAFAHQVYGAVEQGANFLQAGSIAGYVSGNLELDDAPLQVCSVCFQRSAAVL